MVPGMPYSVVRFNCIQPGLEPAAMAARYQAFVEMAGHADEHGLQAISLEEHHGADNGWSPSPLVMAGLVFGRTTRIWPTSRAARAAARPAAHRRGHRGARPRERRSPHRDRRHRLPREEYAAHGKNWKDRGKLQDEAIDTMLKAWTGEPFEYRGTTVRVTPRPFTQPHPMLLLGGTSKVAARRAARFGLPFFPAANLPELEAYYYEQCAEYGTQGFCMMPPEHTVMTLVAEDPDQVWAELGEHFLHEATTYSSWQTPGATSAVHSHATTSTRCGPRASTRWSRPPSSSTG